MSGNVAFFAGVAVAREDVAFSFRQGWRLWNARSIARSVILFGLAVSLATLAIPPFARAASEQIDVTGVRPAKVDTYRSVERLFRRFEAIPLADRPDLAFGMTARLEPGHRPIRQALPYLATRAGNVPLFSDADDEMVFPRTEALWNENPPVMAPLSKDDRIVFHFVFHVILPPSHQFSGLMARRWLGEFDTCAEDVIGFIGALLIPDAHRLSITLSPHARFTVADRGTRRDLVINNGDAPCIYTFRPQDFAKDAVFVSDRPFQAVDIVLPFDLHAEWRRSAG